MDLKYFNLEDFKQLENDLENGLYYSFQIVFIRLYKDIYTYNSHEDSICFKLILLYDHDGSHSRIKQAAIKKLMFHYHK